MAIYVNDFNVWLLEVPVIAVAGNFEFEVWDNLTPVVDQDEGNPNAQPRRRAHIN